MSRNGKLDQQAREILHRNDRGGYTVPTHGLYPFQWNWDSAFVALGFAEFDRDRAWQEIETLVSAQWEDGMIPYIRACARFMPPASKATAGSTGIAIR